MMTRAWYLKIQAIIIGAACAIALVLGIVLFNSSPLINVDKAKAEPTFIAELFIPWR